MPSTYQGTRPAGTGGGGLCGALQVTQGEREAEPGLHRAQPVAGRQVPQPCSQWPAAPCPGQALGAQEAQAESPKTQDG